MKTEDEKQSVVLRMPRALIDRIDKFQKRRGFGTRTSAIFYLINHALDNLDNKNK